VKGVGLGSVQITTPTVDWSDLGKARRVSKQDNKQASSAGNPGPSKHATGMLSV